MSVSDTNLCINLCHCMVIFRFNLTNGEKLLKTLSENICEINILLNNVIKRTYMERECSKRY